MQLMDINIQEKINYTIQLGENIFTQSLADNLKNTPYFLCIDKNVYLYHQELLEPFLQKGVDYLIIEATETNKCQKTVDDIHEMLYQKKATKTDIIVAIGGGIIGDVCGYAAATYMRGIPFIQIPTTLLSQVDSSIGGKVAINAWNTKNIIGTFYSPQHVIIDINFLKTLTERLFKEGLVELIKHGFIQDKTILELLLTVKNIDALRENHDILTTLIKKSLEVKKAVVEADYLDTGIRHILNYGHTFAHALEMTNRKKHLYHGECVAFGMLINAKLTQNPFIYQKTKEIFNQFSCLKPIDEEIDWQKMLYDKKQAAGKIKEIFLSEIGKPEIKTQKMDVLIQDFQHAYEEILADQKIKYSKNCFVFSPTILKGSILIPPSKSYLQRTLLAAALANQPTTIEQVSSLADDVQVAIDVIEKMGAKVMYFPKQQKLEVSPIPDLASLKKQSFVCNMRESGTSLRLFIPVLTHLYKDIYITGENRLPYRPLNTFFTLFDTQQISYDFPSTEQHLPLTVSGIFKNSTFRIKQNTSSQFLSGLLMLAPLLNETVEITLTSSPESLPYIKMTLAVLASFGVEVRTFSDYTRFVISKNEKYQTPKSYTIEQDYSSRTFWEIANQLGKHNIDIQPPFQNSLQGDSVVHDFMQQQQTTIDLRDIPDTAPILAIYLAQKKGMLKNTYRLQYKESNRLEAIQDFLEKMRIPYEQNKNILYINKGKMHGGYFNTYKDHRITMSLIIASTITDEPVIIDEIKSIQKSYPQFIEQYLKLGGEMDEK